VVLGAFVELHMATYFKVAYRENGAVVVQATSERQLAYGDVAVFPESINAKKIGQRVAEFFAELLRGPEPACGSLEWSDMRKLGEQAVELAPAVMSRYGLKDRTATSRASRDGSGKPERSECNSHTSKGGADEPAEHAEQAAKPTVDGALGRIDALIRDLKALDGDLTRDSEQLIRTLKQNLDNTDCEATEELEQLAGLLGLEPATTPADIVKAAIARLNPPTSGKEQMRRIRSAVRSPTQDLPRPTRTRSAD
jgi:hypothetical protein